MITLKSYTPEVATYWNLIKDVKAEVKVRLISMLSESLLTSAKPSVTAADGRTRAFVDRFYGAWHSDKPAEDIIATINRDKSSAAPISFD